MGIGRLTLIERGQKQKMIKTVLLCGLLLSAPLAIMGLKCYVTGTSGADLTDCASGQVCAIIKIDATGQKLQACKDDVGELGCKASTTSVAGTACLCDSDGCNESVEKAGGMKIMSNMLVVFVAMISFFFH